MPVLDLRRRVSSSVVMTLLQSERVCRAPLLVSSMEAWDSSPFADAGSSGLGESARLTLSIDL